METLEIVLNLVMEVQEEAHLGRLWQTVHNTPTELQEQEPLKVQGIQTVLGQQPIKTSLVVVDTMVVEKEQIAQVAAGAPVILAVYPVLKPLRVMQLCQIQMEAQ